MEVSQNIFGLPSQHDGLMYAKNALPWCVTEVIYEGRTILSFGMFFLVILGMATLGRAFVCLLYRVNNNKF